LLLLIFDKDDLTDLPEIDNSLRRAVMNY